MYIPFFLNSLLPNKKVNHNAVIIREGGGDLEGLAGTLEVYGKL